MQGAIYVIEAPLTPWLWPALSLMAIFLQLAAIYYKNVFSLILGLLLIAVACLVEKDLALFIGDLAVTILLLFLWQRSRNIH